MEWIHVVVGILATWGLTEAYSHEAIFKIKKIAQSQLEINDNFITKLLSCTFCVNHWIAFLVSLIISVYHGHLLLIFIYTFVFARCSNLLNDITYEISRTPTCSKFVSLD